MKKHILFCIFICIIIIIIIIALYQSSPFHACRWVNERSEIVRLGISSNTYHIFIFKKTFINFSKPWVCQLKLCKSFFKSKDLGATKKKENKKRISLSKEK
jgi:hypothetical protein